ncbi:hypothetical protein Cantr_00821 [Candida viswanathii]|uniref:Uncharacterized protein n=1 Tax=Candida viswanathii TaxID=5486 RepID=A0A367YGG4_9ASCO|nr:hypothetical protein Cantr_00821 [Candida viswanathii]
MSSLPNPNYLVSPTVSRRRGSSHKRSMSADFDAVGLGIGLGFGNSPRSQQQQLQLSPQTPPRPPPPMFSMQEDLDKDFSFPKFKDTTTTPPPPPPPFKFNQFHRPSKSLNSPIRFQRTDSSIKEIDEEDVDEDGDVDDDDVDLADDDASSYSFFATPRSAANASRYHRIISNVNGVERAVTPPTTLTTPEIIITNDSGAGNKDLYMVASSDSIMGGKHRSVAPNASTSSLSKQTPMSPSSDSPTPTPKLAHAAPTVPTLLSTTTPPLRSDTSTPPLKSTTDLPSPRRTESPAEKKILKETKIPAFKKTNTLTQPSSSSSLSTARTAATTNTSTQSINTATTASPHHLSRNEFKHRGFLQRRESNSTDTSSVSSIRSKLKRGSRIFDWLRKKRNE